MSRNTEHFAPIAGDYRDLATVREVADFFAVSPRTVWAWTSRGDFPLPKQIGPRCRRWSVSELQEWVNRGCPAREER